MSYQFVATRASAILPIAMSLVSLAIVGYALLAGAAPRADGDEGALARIWQLLIVGQLPIVVYFALRWLPREPRAGGAVLAAQLIFGLVALAPVFMLGL